MHVNHFFVFVFSARARIDYISDRGVDSLGGYVPKPPNVVKIWLNMTFVSTYIRKK